MRHSEHEAACAEFSLVHKSHFQVDAVDEDVKLGTVGILIAELGCWNNERLIFPFDFSTVEAPTAFGGTKVEIKKFYEKSCEKKTLTCLGAFFWMFSCIFFLSSGKFWPWKWSNITEYFWLRMVTRWHWWLYLFDCYWTTCYNCWWLGLFGHWCW